MDRQFRGIVNMDLSELDPMLGAGLEEPVSAGGTPERGQHRA